MIETTAIGNLQIFGNESMIEDAMEAIVAGSNMNGDRGSEKRCVCDLYQPLEPSNPTLGYSDLARFL